MASRQNALSAQRKPRASKKIDQGKQPQGIAKAEPQVRRSERISRFRESIQERDIEGGEAEQVSPTRPASKVPEGRVPPQSLYKPSKLHQKREREAGHSSPQDQDRPPSKRPRTSFPSCKAEGEPQKESERDTSKNNADPIETWIRTNKWPSQYFEQGSQTKQDFFEHDSSLEEQMEESNQVVQYVEINGGRYPRPIRKVPTSLRRKQSDSSLTGSSDQKKRESKSAPYRNTRYPILLEAKGSYMREFDVDDIPKIVKDLCRTLLEKDHIVPQDSLFRDDIFAKVCQKVQDRNEAMIIQDITRLIVPSAQNLAIYGATHFKHLVESVNEGWIGSISIEGPRPQPDYSVGFSRSSFTHDQLKRLNPLIGTAWDTSFFVATYRMYFPFFTCEVKCGTAALDTADRQNAHSMTVAVRGVVELYKAVKREKELHREILAFSISHDHSSVRIYGHYPMIDGSNTTFYRHPIREFSFTELDGREKWTAYKFTKNVYDIWMPTHLKRICSIIDQLPPDLSFEVSQGSELQYTETSGLSQEVVNLLLGQSNVESTSQTGQDESELAPVPQTVTPDTSVSRGKKGAAPKPKRRRPAK